MTVFTRSGNTATPDDTWSPVVEGVRQRRRRTDCQPERRAICSGGPCSSASGSQLPVLTSVTTAYLPRNLRPEISSITVHPAGTVFQRPFSTGELEIAGFEDNTSDGRGQTQSPAQPQPAFPRPTAVLGRRIYQKGLQTLSGRQTTKTTIGFSTT